MGLLGDLLGAAAGAALNGINNAITESTLEDASYVGLLFDYTNIPIHISNEIRNDVIQTILIQVGNLIGTEITKETYGKTWNYKTDEYGEESWDAFVVKNRKYNVQFGLYGMAQFAITISGYNCGNCAKVLKEVLEQNRFDNVRFYFKDIPFHDNYWMKKALEELSGNISETKPKKKKPTITIEKGDETIGSVLLKKMDEICKRKSIFNMDTLDFTTKDEDEKHFFILSDGNVSIEFTYESSEVDCIFLKYSKGSKSLSFSFFSFLNSAEIELISGNTSFSVFINKNDDEIVLCLDLVLKLLKTKKIEVPEDFSGTLLKFLDALTSLVSKLYQIKLESQTVEDSLPQEVLNALEILELTEENCTVTEIKKAYRSLVKEFHPDKMQGLTGKMKALAESKMSELNDAYNLLIEYFDID